jgi:hypothetical protein
MAAMLFTLVFRGPLQLPGHGSRVDRAGFHRCQEIDTVAVNSLTANWPGLAGGVEWPFWLMVGSFTKAVPAVGPKAHGEGIHNRQADHCHKQFHDRHLFLHFSRSSCGVWRVACIRGPT